MARSGNRTSTTRASPGVDRIEATAAVLPCSLRWRQAHVDTVHALHPRAIDAERLSTAAHGVTCHLDARGLVKAVEDALPHQMVVLQNGYAHGITPSPRSGIATSVAGPRPTGTASAGHGPDPSRGGRASHDRHLDGRRGGPSSAARATITVGEAQIVTVNADGSGARAISTSPQLAHRPGSGPRSPCQSAIRRTGRGGGKPRPRAGRDLRPAGTTRSGRHSGGRGPWSRSRSFR